MMGKNDLDFAVIDHHSMIGQWFSEPEHLRMFPEGYNNFSYPHTIRHIRYQNRLPLVGYISVLSSVSQV